MHLIRFIKSVFAEMKLVTWPTARETRHDTWGSYCYITFICRFLCVS